jgi:hypothetical protein
MPTKPTQEFVEHWFKRFMDTAEFLKGEEVVQSAIYSFPDNTNLYGIMVKCSLVQAIYHTRIIDMVGVAERMQECALDDHLRAGSPLAVEEIVRCTNEAEGKRHISFASKYCSFHEPERYPIIDSILKKLLVRYQREFRFSATNFRQTDLENIQDYAFLRRILDDFRAHFGLLDVSYKKLDQCLWMFGREWLKEEEV